MSNQMQEVMDAELAQAIALLNEANRLMESLFSTKEESVQERADRTNPYLLSTREAE